MIVPNGLFGRNIWSHQPHEVDSNFLRVMSWSELHSKISKSKGYAHFVWDLCPEFKALELSLCCLFSWGNINYLIPNLALFKAMRIPEIVYFSSTYSLHIYSIMNFMPNGAYLVSNNHNRIHCAESRWRLKMMMLATNSVPLVFLLGIYSSRH